MQDHLNALPGSTDELAGLLQETRDQLQQSQQRDEAPQLNASQQAAATLLHLMEVSGALLWCETAVGLFQISPSPTMPGGVPWYLRQIFLKYLPKAGSIEAAGEAFSAKCAKDVRKDSFTHYRTLAGGSNPLLAKQNVGDLLR